MYASLIKYSIEVPGKMKKKTMCFIGVEVEQETSAPPPKKKSWIRPYNERLQNFSLFTQKNNNTQHSR